MHLMKILTFYQNKLLSKKSIFTQAYLLENFTLIILILQTSKTDIKQDF